MTVTGDRQSASLLSALAEAPDSAAASSFLATQIAEMSGAERVIMLRLDAAQESLVAVASNDLPDAPAVSIPVSDLSNPLVIAALALSPVSGRTPLPPPFSDFTQWAAMPMQQLRTRNAPTMLTHQRAADLLASSGHTLGPRSERGGPRPGGRGRPGPRRRPRSLLSARRVRGAHRARSTSEPNDRTARRPRGSVGVGRPARPAERAISRNGEFAAGPGRDHHRGERHHRAEPPRPAGAGTARR